LNFFLNIHLFLSITILGISCSNSSSKNVDKIIKTNIIQHLEASVFEAKLSKSNGILLDVRTEEEIRQGYIHGASFINLYDENFNQKINFIQKDKPVFVYCKMGGRSAKAAQELLSIGFKEVYNLTGGIQAWYNNGYTIEQDSIIKPVTQEFSIEQFNEMLNSTNVPTVICFQTKWCLPCKQMNPILSEISDSLKGDVNFVKIDLDNNLDISKQFNIQSVPTFVGMLNGAERWRQAGFIEKTHLLNMIISLK
tara:strand:- start:2076 stop:2831 length:756 start_codon:yes stop_codon:yes gene_type:complete